MKQINRKIPRFFSALSDETRLRILLTLTEKPKTVNEIHKSFRKDEITLSAISHQLRYLSDADIIIYEKRGREKTYKLSGNFCWCMLRDAVKHFDNRTLKRGTKKSKGCGC